MTVEPRMIETKGLTWEEQGQLPFDSCPKQEGGGV